MTAMTARVATTAVLAAVLGAALLTAGCGGGSQSVSVKEPDPPVGDPLMPDIAPAPPQDAIASPEDGTWYIRFTTALLNIGEGDFVLRALKGVRDWTIFQDVYHSGGGAKVFRTRAPLVWGGDGHSHWHVERVAIGHLVPLGKDGKPRAGEKGFTDTKIGFCYFDTSRWFETGPAKPVYLEVSCGDEEDTAIGVGLSVGWADVYPRAYVGQTIDITDVPDGRYRLQVEVDASKWFHEARRDNNVTWADLSIVTKKSGKREVVNVESGPPIRVES